MNKIRTGSSTYVTRVLETVYRVIQLLDQRQKTFDLIDLATDIIICSNYPMLLDKVFFIN